MGAAPVCACNCNGCGTYSSPHGPLAVVEHVEGSHNPNIVNVDELEMVIDAPPEMLIDAPKCSHVGYATGNSMPDSLRDVLHLVQIAISPVSPWVPGVPRAYHTSVVVDGMEYSFGADGLTMSRVMASHDSYGTERGPAELRNLGLTTLSGSAMHVQMKQFFKKGSYDALRKNCNTFTDCALVFLLGSRLMKEFQIVEQVATSVNARSGIVEMFGPRLYEANEAVRQFDVQGVISALHAQRDEALLKSVGKVRWAELTDIRIEELIIVRADEIARDVDARRSAFEKRRGKKPRPTTKCC